jgi:hypothetical protein
MNVPVTFPRYRGGIDTTGRSVAPRNPVMRLCANSSIGKFKAWTRFKICCPQGSAKAAGVNNTRSGSHNLALGGAGFAARRLVILTLDALGRYFYFSDAKIEVSQVSMRVSLLLS